MSDTQFIDKETVVTAGWLQDVNDYVYQSGPASVQDLSDNLANNIDPTKGAVLVGYKGQTVTDRLGYEIWVEDFGAVGDGIIDDTAAIQAALNATTVAGVAGNATTVRLASRRYRITDTLDIPALCSIMGCGPESVLRPEGCTAFNFLPSNSAGVRKISDFWIYGNGCSTNTAITCDLDSGAGGRITNVLIENVYISFFGLGISLWGGWNTTIRKCAILNSWRSIVLKGRNIKTLIVDCALSLGSATDNGGDSTGISVEFYSTARPEDTWIKNSIVYGFDNAIDWSSGLNGGVVECDLDVCQKNGLIATITDGGFVVKNNWIAVYNTATKSYGVKLSPVGTLQTVYPRIIEGNLISCFVTPIAGSAGVFAGSLVNGPVIEKNTCNGWDYGIHTQGTQNVCVEKNTTTGSITNGLYLESCENVSVERNTFDKVIALNASNLHVNFGKNFGASTTYAVGSIPIPGGQTTATVTFASLGLPDIPANADPYVFFNNPSSSNRSEVWGICNNTGITVYVETAFGSPVGVFFEVKCIVL